MPDIRVKICGLKTPGTVASAVASGAQYLGFNFFAKSPRYAAPELARDLAGEVPPGVAKVGLVVDADDAALDALLGIVPLDMIQLHGHESPDRVAEIKNRWGLPVMKAIGIAEAADLAQIDAYCDVADQLLIDAKAPKGAVLPGGNGLAFDWQLLATRKYWRCPWMLAGGLTSANVAEAVARTGARQVDVSSGVENGPGIKDSDLIADFVRAAQS